MNAILDEESTLNKGRKKSKLALSDHTRGIMSELGKPGTITSPPAAADSQRGSFHITRAEFLKGQNRPIVGTPMKPYIVVKELNASMEEGRKTPMSDRSSEQESNESSSMDRPLRSSAATTRTTEILDADDRVQIRWFRGPKVTACVYHPHRPGKYRDIARTRLMYCSTQCLEMGFRRIPDTHCVAFPPSSLDDLQYNCSLAISLGDPNRAKPVGGRVKCWTVVGNALTYTPTLDDKECILCCEIATVSEDPIRKKPIYLQTLSTFDASLYTPPLREMLSVFGALEHIQSGLAVKVLNWNILADIYATDQVYDYCYPWALNWAYRKTLILKQIAALDGDIVCLQEVQNDTFESDLRPAMESLGFDFVYAPKTRTMFTNKYMSEGACIFYRSNRFRKIDHYVLDFDARAAEMTNSGSMTKSQLNRLSKGNIALLTLLEDNRHGGRPLVVATTHITADIDAGDVKIWQCQTLLDCMHDWVLHRIGTSGLSTPMLLCGDFNSTPDSSVYELLISGHANGHEIDDPFGIIPNPLGHSLPLRSVHQAVVGHEAQVTNFTTRFSGTLDYICFTSTTLRALAVSNGYSYEELSKDVAVPSPTQPSDHVLTVGVFAYMMPWQ
jgi:CCR4-NOT transcription complex subunit 6